MFTEVTTMADGGGSVAREESGADLLYTRVRWRGDSQVHQDGKVTVWRGVRQQRGAGTAAAPVAGSGPSGRRRQDRRARTRGTRRVAQGECGKKAARRKWGGGLRRADRGTEAYLGVRAQRDCDAGVARDTARVARLAQFEIRLALFEQIFLQNFNRSGPRSG
jgi:hypothetical protein